MPPLDRAGLNHIRPVNGLAKALACGAGSVVEDGNEDVLSLMSVLPPLYQIQGQIEEGGSKPDREWKKEIPSISPNTKAVDFVNAPTDTSQSSEPKQASVFISAWRHTADPHLWHTALLFPFWNNTPSKNNTAVPQWLAHWNL